MSVTMTSTTTKSEEFAPLEGARVRRIDVPESDLAALTVSLEGTGGPRVEAVLLLSFAPAHPGLGLVLERPRGAPATSFCMLLRKHLEGAVLVTIEGDGRALALRFRRGPERRVVVIGPGMFVLELEDRAHTQRAGVLDPLASPRWELPRASTRQALEEAGSALLEARAGRDEREEVRSLLAALRKLARRLEQRVRAVERDLARSEEVPELRARGALLLANLAAIPRGASEARLLDPSEEPPREVVVELDPARDPREQAGAWFERARKLERGERISRERLARSRETLARADALLRALADPAGHDDAALGAARALVSSESGTPRARGPRPKPEPRLPYRRIVGHGEREIRVGRGARDNDALTQKHAASHDLWLHARGVAGAHVVVPLARGEVCPAELLLDAATLAAHFSDARGERVVEVDHLPRGKVRKRKGMPPGKVEIDHPKTLAVRVEARRLERLLGRTSS
jgi:predicted ribosome quality control (RQC) complex YloA/Tae2 family protein